MLARAYARDAWWCADARLVAAGLRGTPHSCRPHRTLCQEALELLKRPVALDWQTSWFAAFCGSTNGLSSETPTPKCRPSGRGYCTVGAPCVGDPEWEQRATVSADNVDVDVEEMRVRSAGMMVCRVLCLCHAYGARVSEGVRSAMAALAKCGSRCQSLACKRSR